MGILFGGWINDDWDNRQPSEEEKEKARILAAKQYQKGNSPVVRVYDTVVADGKKMYVIDIIEDKLIVKTLSIKIDKHQGASYEYSGDNYKVIRSLLSET